MVLADPRGVGAVLCLYRELVRHEGVVTQSLVLVSCACLTRRRCYSMSTNLVLQKIPVDVGYRSHSLTAYSIWTLFSCQSLLDPCTRQCNPR